MSDWMYAHTLPDDLHPEGCQCGCSGNVDDDEAFEFRAATIDDHGLCPVCGQPVQVYDSETKRTHSCDACGYHDVTFKWMEE